MPEINFIETSAEEIYNKTMTQLENGISEMLYPGDERRIFGEALVQVIVSIYNSVNDAAKQRLLKYARGETLNALGENKSVKRNDPSKAVTTMRLGLYEAIASNIIIPSGVKVTSDFTRYFEIDETAVLYAGDLFVDIPATATEGGAQYNDITIGEIVNIVDASDIPLIDYVSNIEITSKGGDQEDDESYRERIRQAENSISTAGSNQAYKYYALSSNSKVSDAEVMCETETITKNLKNYGGNIFKAGQTLHIETLKVFKTDDSEAVKDIDYTVLYEEELLQITLYRDLLEYETVKIEISQTLSGTVTIVPICAGGEIPDEDVLDDVLQACSADNVKPLTDKVRVKAPDVSYFDIELTYYCTKANESKVIETVEGSGGAIDRYVYWQTSSLNLDINPDYLRKLILAPDWEEELEGAVRVEITKPTYTELNSTTIAKFSGSKIVCHTAK